MLQQVAHRSGLAVQAERLLTGVKARALVVNGGMSPAEATALLLETAWSILHIKPAPSFEG